MPATETILQLVERFDRNRDDYTSDRYNEARLRTEFLNPFFGELGWDVHNSQGYAEAYKDVIHEDAIRIGSALKAPDYCFRIGGTRKFFVEAKKPSVRIRDEQDPALQLRRYAWSAKLPLSILTDFEEFAVYDCRIRPGKTDKADRARILYFTFDQYPDCWDEIASVFSRDAVLKGSFDRFAASKRKRGTSEVDDAFLAEIEHWRDLLAHNINLRNPGLSARQLNFAVQQTIDRIIFLRIAEDRGIERYGQLQSLLSGSEVYPRLFGLFQRADDRYNSGLFHFQKEKGRHEDPDELTPALAIDDKPLKDILRSLYYPESPYEFSVLPAEILGHVYEQFLGKVVTRSTTGKTVRIEEKPEVKKAGGVYYTPAYIVEYIVKNTVGKLLESRSVEFFKTRPPRMDEPLTILDPACGSGSFLLGAYQYLLDWHLEYYSQNEPRQWLSAKHPPIVETTGGADRKSYKLTVEERKRILLDHIYGVDIDSQAVEVTKLSLLLKVLEGEKQLHLFAAERALPDLADNIKCGNSLIGPDFYHGRQLALFDEEQRLKINAFDWNAEYPDIMSRGGFDAVIGNPPWGALFTKDEKTYLVVHFPNVPTKTKDSYFYFISEALILLKQDSLLGFIIPNTWLLINHAESYRRFLLEHELIEIRDYGDGVFSKAIVESCTIVMAKTKSKLHTCRVFRLRKDSLLTNQVVDTEVWLEDPNCRINIDLTRERADVLTKLSHRAVLFEEKCIIKWGIKPYQTGYGNPPQTKEMISARVYHSDVKHDDSWKSLLVGSDVDRYQLTFQGNQFIKYGKNLMYPSDETLMKGSKLLVRQTSDIIRSVYDEEGYYCQNSVFIVYSSDFNLHYLLGILNSRLMRFVYSIRNPQIGKIFAEIKPSVIKQLPICTIDFENPNEKVHHNQMVELVESMLQLHKDIQTVRTPEEKRAIERQIAATDQQIDRLVYELYGLTDEEIRLVEEATAKTETAKETPHG
ncbi:MAG: N-6 DNA methylase [Sedimentisphaerales bacterium]|nr:N-6 DNA methylase [Sedimentisphaerales bacterium]